MALWAKLILGGLGLIGMGLGLAIWLGSTRWSKTTSQYVKKLVPAVPQQETRTVTFENFERLPAPVARYLRFALKEGQSLIRSARISQTGELRAIGKSEGGWNPFEARQYFSLQPPGFVWDARIRTFPLMHVRVRDAYVAGQASGQVSLFSLVTLANEHGKAELDAGALHRYLAESAWIPTAFLPGQGVKWSPIDNNKALATMTDSHTTVFLEFHFNDTGEVTGIYTPGRYGYFDGKYELTPWEGHFRRYEERDGMRVPTEADVEWHLPTGRFPVWKGKIIGVEYDFVR